MRTIEQMIQSEVLCCMSSMVSTLAQGYGAPLRQAAAHKEHDNALRDLDSLIEQAFELASPIPDYEEAALQAVSGWSRSHCEDVGYPAFGNASDELSLAAMRQDILKHVRESDDACAWENFCEANAIDPYDREVFEHWAVTDWFADKLIAEGEKVDKDFAGLCVWARTTTGQGIASDGMIERLYAKTHQQVEA